MKDDLIKKIIETEKQIEHTRKVYTEQKELVIETKEHVTGAQKAYDEVKRQLDFAAEVLDSRRSNYRDARESLGVIEGAGKTLASQLEVLKRELARAEDAERVNADYLAQVEAFRQKTLEAPWRKENRTDGYGAYQHQIEGAIHLAVAKQGFLGDKRGLGKSLTGLIYLDITEAKRVILVCPSDTMDNYIREIKFWAPHRSVIKIGKMPRAQRDFILPNLRQAPEYIIVINYEAWRKDETLVQDLIRLRADTLVYDEAHKAKTWDTVTCRGLMDLRFGLNECPSCRLDYPVVKQLKSSYTDAQCECSHKDELTKFCSIKHVLPMTGTPILNKPQEFFPHLKVIAPHLFKKESEFLRDYCRKQSNGHWTWQYNAEKELIDKIGPRYLARDRKTAGIVIPPASPVEHIITQADFRENYPKQWKAYQQVRDYAQLVLDKENELVMSMPYMIVVLMRLRQVLAWPAGIVLKSKDEFGEEIIHGRLEVHESVKLDKAEELIKDITEEGDRVLGFSMFKDPVFELEHRIGSRACSYTGDTSSYRKNLIQLDFDPKTAPRNPKWDVLLGTYKAMGEGLNLNSATHEILIDLPWNPGTVDQATGRIDRIGTTKDTYVHKIKVEGTVDTWMERIIDEKYDMINNFSSQADLAQEVYRALREGEM